MNRGFTKGLVIGGILAASVSMMMNNEPKSRRRMMRNSRNFIRKSGGIIGEVMDIFR